MLLAEYNEAEKLALVRDNAWRDGQTEGRAEGVFDTLAALVKDGILSVKDAALRAGVSESAFKQRMTAK